MSIYFNKKEVRRKAKCNMYPNAVPRKEAKGIRRKLPRTTQWVGLWEDKNEETRASG